MTPVIALLDGVGAPELLVIGILALLMFGSQRLPELGRAFGRALREFKRATSGVEESIREVMRDPPRKPVVRSAPKQVPSRHNPPPSTSKPEVAPAEGSGTQLELAAVPPADETSPRKPALQEAAPEEGDDPYAPSPPSPAPPETPPKS